MKKYVCTICGYVYDEAVGDAENGIEPGTTWEQLGDDWACPLCGAVKGAFEEQKTEEKADMVETNIGYEHELRALSDGEMSAVLSNLAKGCEKQFQFEQAECYNKLAEYYLAKSKNDGDKADIDSMLKENLDSDFKNAKSIVESLSDRGALRALVWSEKVSRIVSSILNRYKKQKADLLKDKKIYVCEICGFVYIGNEAPEICPVCKVPNLKISEVKREAI